MLVSLLQLLNADFPMVVTPLGIIMLVRLLQLQNPHGSIDVTPSGIVYVVNPDGANATNLPSIMRHR